MYIIKFLFSIDDNHAIRVKFAKHEYVFETIYY